VHNSYVQSRWYRAPEVMLGCPWDVKVDMWALGCVLAEVLIGQPLFRRSAVEAVLAAQIAVLGPIPTHMTDMAPELVSQFLTSNGRAYQVDPPGMARGVYVLQPLAKKTLAHLLGDAVNVPIFGGQERFNAFFSFLSSLLSIDPAHRSSATQASQHAWLQSSTEGIAGSSSDIA